MDKQDLRSKIKKRMSCLGVDEIRLRSKKIVDCFKNFESFQTSNHVCIYVSKDQEVFTHDFIREFFNQKKFLVPFIEHRGMKLSQIDDLSLLSKGKFGILESKKKIEYKGRVDLVIVPGIAFDKKCNRLGRGKGYYDKFLKDTNALKIGLAFDEQIVDEAPVEKHDVAMDMVLTDKQIIRAD